MATVSVGTENGAPIHLHYEDHGTGRPVVLLHGWPLSSRSWERQLPALIAAGYRVITYDRRGFGWSSQPWSGYDYDTLAADLYQLLEHLHLRDVTLVGFSMGGGEVARYIRNYGLDRLRQAVLAAAVPPYLYKCADNPDGGVDDATLEQLQEGVKGDRLAFLDTFLRNFFASGSRNDLISEPALRYHHTIATFASPKATLDCIHAFGRTDFRRDLEKMTLPTLILHGDADPIVPYEVSGKRAHAMIPGSRVALIPEGPHGLNFTHAAEFNRALLEFLGS